MPLPSMALSSSSTAAPTSRLESSGSTQSTGGYWAFPVTTMRSQAPPAARLGVLTPNSANTSVADRHRPPLNPLRTAMDHLRQFMCPQYSDRSGGRINGTTVKAEFRVVFNDGLGFHLGKKRHPLIYRLIRIGARELEVTLIMASLGLEQRSIELAQLRIQM